MPARVIWQSEIIPPSPVTIVYERKTIASATPCANTPTQNWSKIQKSLNSTGSSASTIGHDHRADQPAPTVRGRERGRVAVRAPAGAAVDLERLASEVP